MTRALLPPFARVLGLVVAALAAIAWPGRAHAYEERLEISLGAGPALAFADDVAPGAGVDLALSRGVSDRWSLGGSLRYELYHHGTLDHRAFGLLEATWALDIVQWVPRITFGTGPLLAASDGARAGGLVGSLRIGADRITGFGLVGLELRIEGYGFVDDVVPGRASVALQLRIGWLRDRF